MIRGFELPGMTYSTAKDDVKHDCALPDSRRSLTRVSDVAMSKFPAVFKSSFLPFWLVHVSVGSTMTTGALQLMLVTRCKTPSTRIAHLSSLDQGGRHRIHNLHPLLSSAHHVTAYVLAAPGLQMLPAMILTQHSDPKAPKDHGRATLSPINRIFSLEQGHHWSQKQATQAAGS